MFISRVILFAFKIKLENRVALQFRVRCVLAFRGEFIRGYLCGGGPALLVGLALFAEIPRLS